MDLREFNVYGNAGGRSVRQRIVAGIVPSASYGTVLRNLSIRAREDYPSLTDIRFYEIGKEAA